MGSRYIDHINTFDDSHCGASCALLGLCGGIRVHRADALRPLAVSGVMPYVSFGEDVATSNKA